MGAVDGIAILGAIALAAAMVWLPLKLLRKKGADEALFGVYTNLLDLYGYYFWVVSAVNKGDPEMHEKVKMLNRILLGYLPKVNYLPFAKELRELLQKRETKTQPAAAAYYRDLGAVIKKMEGYIHKNNLAVSRKILKNNLQLEVRMTLYEEDSQGIFNAPGFINWVPRKNKNKK